MFGFGDLFVIVGFVAIVVRVGLEGGLFLPAIKRTVTAEADGRRTVDPLMRWSPSFDVALFGSRSGRWSPNSAFDCV
jgi:hypothetical protein